MDEMMDAGERVVRDSREAPQRLSSLDLPVTIYILHTTRRSRDHLQDGRSADDQNPDASATLPPHPASQSAAAGDSDFGRPDQHKRPPPPRDPGTRSQQPAASSTAPT
ncbi:hypothetical protein E4U41_004345 [Claviceps citrina]|nr:hypothetical protein E4U41_004345 [Claviceps citrina]